MTESSANVETYRRIIQAWNDEGVEGVLPYYDEDIEIYDPDLPGDGVYRGRDAVRGVLETISSGFARMEIRDWELIPVGDRVVGLLHTRGEDPGRAGLDVEIREAHTLTFRDGKAVYWRAYLDRRDALAEAGLDPALLDSLERR
ncbi:MAG: nuclear transport factor 2 family protein [Solirubrobacterales bacterium]